MPELSDLVSYYLRIFLLPFYYSLVAMILGYIFVAYGFFSKKIGGYKVALGEKVGFIVIFVLNIIAFAVLHYLANVPVSNITTSYTEDWFSRGVRFVMGVWFLNGFYWMVYLAWKDAVPLILRYFLLLVFLFAFSGIFTIGIIAMIESSFAHKLCLGISCGMKESLFDYLNSI